MEEEEGLPGNYLETGVIGRLGKPTKGKPLWTCGGEEQRKPKRFGYGSNAEGPDLVNL